MWSCRQAIEYRLKRNVSHSSGFRRLIIQLFSADFGTRGTFSLPHPGSFHQNLKADFESSLFTARYGWSAPAVWPHPLAVYVYLTERMEAKAESIYRKYRYPKRSGL